MNFGSNVALDDVDLEIREGEIVGLIGANGAGKSTTIALLQGAVAPTSGTVSLFGGDPRDPRSRLRLGTTPQSVALPDTLRVSELIALVGAHFKTRTGTADLCEEFGIAPFLHKRAGSLSGGQQRAVAVALAFVGNPKLVLLDEPTAGLDLTVRRRLREAVARRASAGCTVLLTSHYFEDMDDLASRLVVLEQGRVTADGSMSEMMRTDRQADVSFLTDDPRAFDGLGEEGSNYLHGRLHLLTQDADTLLRAIYAVGSPVDDLEIRRSSLEESLLAIPRSPSDEEQHR